MKTTVATPFPRLLLALLLLVFATSRARAAAEDEGSIATAELSAPGKPASLRIDIPWADIEITGVDGNKITVASTLSQRGKREDRADGLRRLDAQVSFELVEKNNVVNLRLAGGTPWASHDAEFKISVPRGIALDVKTETGGDLVVKNIEGDIEITNMNGEVRLEGISGSTVVNTVNGEVKATYAKPPQKLVSITSMNGEIELRVPAETKANIRLRTHNGSILTDFDETVLQTKSEGKAGGNYHADEAARIGAEAAQVAAEATRSAIQIAREVQREIQQAIREETGGEADEKVTPPRPPRAPRPPVTGGKLVSGTLNGGGVDIKISTMNGEITLRQTTTASLAEKVTVNFSEPDKFTDLKENNSNLTSDAYVDEIRIFTQKTAAPLLTNGRRLVLTFTDIDMAGDTNLSRMNDVRVVTDVTLPRLKFDYQVLDASGKVLREGKENLSDLNFQSNLRFTGRDEPLFHEKELLKKWLRSELKKK